MVTPSPVADGAVTVDAVKPIRSWRMPPAPRWCLPILGLLTVATFAAGLLGGFVLDDQRAILEHPVVRGAVPVTQAFTRTFWGAPLGSHPPSYRPVATLSFALDHALFGPSPLAFHLVSLAWYLGLMGAAWVFARRCMSPLAAFAALAFFATMPVHVENVTSLVGRADTLGVLASVLVLLTLSPFILDGSKAARGRIPAAMLLFLLGLLAKESIAILPVVVGLFIESVRRKSAGTRSFPRAHLPTAALFATLGMYLGARLLAQPDTFTYVPPDDVLVGAGWLTKLGYGCERLAGYARLIMAPVDLCTGKKYAEVARPEGLSLSLLAGLGLVVLAIALSARARRKGALPLVPSAFAAWFLISGLPFTMPESMADRFLLLPTFFLCLATGPALSAFGEKGRIRRGLLLLALAVQSLLAAAQTRTWRNDDTLLSHAVAVCPDSVHNHFRYAEHLSDQGHPSQALWHFAVASQGASAFPRPWTHPAKEAEWSLPIETRLRQMHQLLQVPLDETIWRQRFRNYLVRQGRNREAALLGP